ncbi:regulator of Ty1 Transposition [Saxophila tyrrhenica]|uniref:Regulator of Ty1 Transposition n=1 Tax=Saxophila tyrrhenica TaxID=1690608 RepID=A0AAV9P5X7_9PEZI|nr:regulator of Ty1 Transposition [Saxophila tyrrhenica]
MEEDGRGPLFEGVAHTILPSDEIDSDKTQALIEALHTNGGRYLPVRSGDQRIMNLDDLTHIISTTIDFPEYTAALEHGISVVKPSWVTASVQKRKQAQPRQHSPDPSQYFQHVVLTCASLPEGDQDAIIAGVIALGGQYSSPLSKLVTHIVTEDMEHPKCHIAQDRDLPCKIVLPHWFDDCLKLGRLISERPYLHPDPEYLRKDNTTKVRDSNTGTLDGATVASPPSGTPLYSPPCSPSESRKNLNALVSRKVKLGEDLQLSSRLRVTLEDLINHAGASTTDDVEEAHVYVGNYRDGEDYVKASRAGLEVGNLSWLYHVINRNKYASPQAKLLHYPIPRNGLPGFADMRISISNYTGDARIYLENLIRYTGAEFTKTMKQDNTHLITAHTNSEKCEAAQEWQINIVNHIWLEESFAKCAVQPLTNPRYTHFPARTNLGEVAGQTRFDMKKVEQMFFAKPRESPQKAVRSPDATAKSSKPASSVGAVLAGSKNNRTDMPSPAQVANDTGFDEPSTIKKGPGRPRKSVSTPRFREDEKENESPLPSTGRASKIKASEAIHGHADDIALFQKEMKRKGGVTHGTGRRPSQTDLVSSPIPAPKPRKKRTSDEATYDATKLGSDLSDGETQAQDLNTKAAKKAKLTAPAELPPVRYRMMVTGDERWMSSKRQEDADRRSLRQLGVLVTIDPRDVQILVAPQIKRTRKFVSALACAPTVVNTSYLDHALNENGLIEDPELLQDDENEERFGFTLADALERAKINNRKLFHGWTIYVTRDVPGGFDTYKDIVELNGGSAVVYGGRKGLELAKRAQDDSDAGPEVKHQGGKEEFGCVYLVAGESAAEKHLSKLFRELAANQGLEARVVKHDWLLNTAMSQEVVWDEERYALKD